ncbi:hypothetical protein [Rathayibacter sp. VKM Ac-2630]|uniref:hypothetical protein n=1 Tax=Rathayibacter sp. VKM Ac-2630 TaxID=1938617 RepID=UPI001F304E39|nr:hypothetical protein [Rathayibacter sp. VKM Ac-2630]
MAVQNATNRSTITRRSPRSRRSTAASDASRPSGRTASPTTTVVWWAIVVIAPTTAPTSTERVPETTRERRSGRSSGTSASDDAASAGAGRNRSTRPTGNAGPLESRADSPSTTIWVAWASRAARLRA